MNATSNLCVCAYVHAHTLRNKVFLFFNTLIRRLFWMYYTQINFSFIKKKLGKQFLKYIPLYSLRRKIFHGFILEEVYTQFGILWGFWEVLELKKEERRRGKDSLHLYSTKYFLNMTSFFLNHMKTYVCWELLS